jgi:uncharacterized protein CbrC (UPF0167 family)
VNTIKGLENFIDVTKKIGQVKQAFADEFLRRVVQRTPVRTGLLKDSWDMAVKRGKIELKNIAKNEEGDEYVTYVEFGTYKMPGFFMVTLTVIEAEEILQIAKKNVGL